MGKAACSSSKLTRRAAIGVALAGAATPALPASDAAFALIATDQKAFARLNETIADIARLEHDIPEDRRQEWAPEDRDEGIGLNDEPRWTAALDAHNAAIDAETAAAGSSRTHNRRRSLAQPPCCATRPTTRNAATRGPTPRAMKAGMPPFTRLAAALERMG